MGQRETDDQIVRFFMQHVVALNVAWDSPDGQRHRDAYTCFVLEFRGVWLLLTAGHSLLKLYDALPRYSRIECSLFDAWHAKASTPPVPFALLDASRFVMDADGFDLGAVCLEPIYRRALEANGIRAFDERAWRNPPPDMLCHALLGLPDQFMNRRVTSTGSVELSVNPTLIYVNRIDPPTEMAKPFPCFYGKLPDNLHNPTAGTTLHEMSGFSGAPILGFKANDKGQMKYFLVAVQSAWRRDLRVVVGPLVSAIAQEFEKGLDE